MTDPKTNAGVPPAAGTSPDAPAPASPPQDPNELSDAELSSVAGGVAPSAGSLAVDDYSATNFLEF